MSYQYESIVTVAAGGIGILGGMMKRIEGGWGLSHIGISAAEEIVGEHLLVGGAVAVEIVSEGKGQRERIKQSCLIVRCKGTSFPRIPHTFLKKFVSRTIKIRRASSTLRIVIQS